MQRAAEITKLKQLLPLDNFNTDKVELGGQITSYRKGEKAVHNIVNILIGGAVVGGIILSLPFILATLTKIMTITILCGGLFLLFAFAPVINTLIRRFVRWSHQAIIEFDPIATLREKQENILENKAMLREGNNRIKGLATSLQRKSNENEKVAKEAANALQENKITLASLKNKQMTPHDKKMKMLNLNGSISRNKTRFESANALVKKYGARANQMLKVSQQLDIAEIESNNKYEEFKLTVDGLEEALEFSKVSSEATTVASSLLGNVQSWEIDYAIEYVNKVVDYDLATTQSNMQDIMSITGGDIDIDSDVMYNKIQSINLNVNNAAKYTDSTYKLSAEEKHDSGLNLF